MADNHLLCGPDIAPRDWRALPVESLTRAERVCRFVEGFCRVPEGALMGQPIQLADFQERFLYAVYDNPAGTKRAILSIARKNGKSGLIAGLILAHLIGPEAQQNTQLVSGAMSREQAALVFNLACKMIQLSPELTAAVRIVPSSKRLIGIAMNTEYKALAAEGKTAHGLSPALAILDEVGQVTGPRSEFVDAITTSMGAHKAPLLVTISTQAPNDGDLLSIWIDDARQNHDERTVCHLYAADKDCDVEDETQWRDANPALGIFRSEPDVREQAARASRMPSFEPTFRNLILNQRVDMVAPFITRGVWTANSGAPDVDAFYSRPVFVGVDLSARNDLTAMVIAAYSDRWNVRAIFWTPEKGLRDRAKNDRAPYDVWAKDGLIRTVPGASIDYSFVATDIMDALDGMDVQALAFDRWRFDQLKAELDRMGVTLPMQPFGQGFRDMAPALDAVEAALLNEQVAHGGNPVLTMCMANARVETDAAGNRKLNKRKATGRIDGAVALCMALGIATKQELVEAEKFEMISL